MITPALPNETALLQQMIAGDAMAFRKIYEFYSGRVFAFAFSHIKSRDMAEEAVQEVFIRLWTKRDQIRLDKSLEGYIKVAVRNQIINMLRKAALDHSIQQKIGNALEALRNSPPEQLLEKELSKLLDLAVKGLSPQQQLVYRLSREEELTYEQISLRLGISKETTKTHMKEALKSIRNYIRRHADLGCLILAIILREK